MSTHLNVIGFDALTDEPQRGHLAIQWKDGFADLAIELNDGTTMSLTLSDDQLAILAAGLVKHFTPPTPSAGEQKSLPLIKVLSRWASEENQPFPTCEAAPAPVESGAESAELWDAAN